MALWSVRHQLRRYRPYYRPYTGKFDNIGTLVQPSEIANLQLSYDVSPRITPVGTFANIIDRRAQSSGLAFTRDATWLMRSEENGKGLPITYVIETNPREFFSMKAMQVNPAEHGTVLISVEMAKPKPGSDDVLIHVRAAGVTTTELHWSTTTHTKEGAARTRAVPGHEFSGDVAALGGNVRGFKAGDEVYGMNDWYADGATAEFCVAFSENIARKPASLSHEAAAAVPIAALTAWQGLLDRAKIQPGERVLVHGGAGAVGLFAVQLAHLHGSYVIATVSGQDIDFVKQLGADEAIDYNVTRFEEHVKNVDAVFDAVGGDTLNRSWSVLKPGGRMVTIAADGETATEQRVKDAYFIVEPNQTRLVEIARLLDEGHLKAFVKAIVPFGDASAAYDGALKNKGGRGKLIIAIPA